MDRSLYVAMSGAKQTLMAQTTNANNLANAQTSGFKSDFEQFRSQSVFGPGYPTRVYAMSERPGTDMTPGGLQTTENPLDVAIKGEGWIAVQDATGQEAYTRAGDLKVTTDGLLQTNAGLPVQGNGGPIALPPFDKISIGQDGSISIIPLGGGSTAMTVVDRIKLVTPDNADLEKMDDGLMHLKPTVQKKPEPDADVQLVQGALEGSNVSAVTAMVEMIELARNFELQTKVMRTVDENSAASAKLMKMS
ncbi:MAG: flagellar basal-body rod protein FlgF [Methylococcaceae bacterium]|nr:flagellar basal-body rod protein FlgF [Methylococcaceae bacterium]